MIIDLFRGARILTFWDFIDSYQPVNGYEIFPQDFLPEKERTLNNVLEFEVILNDCIWNDHYVLRSDTLARLLIGFISYQSIPTRYNVRLTTLRQHYGYDFDRLCQEHGLDV